MRCKSLFTTDRAVLGIVAGAGAILSVLGLMSAVDGRPEPAPEPRPGASRSGPNTAQVPESPPAAPPPVLFSLVPGPEGCSWETRELPELVPSVLRVTDRCPGRMLWIGKPGEGDLIYEQDGSLIRIEGSGETEVLALPRPDFLVHFWIDEESARLRVGYVAGIPCEWYDGWCTYEVEQRTIRSERDADGWERFVMKDGWADVPAGEAERRSLPPWGTRGVALAYESDLAGGWAMVSAAPTRSETDDTPGLGVLDVSEAPGTVTLSELRDATTCWGDRRFSTGCDRHSGPLPSWFSQQLEELDEVGSLSFEGGDWIFRIVYWADPHLDPPQIKGPVFLDCGPTCEPVPLSLPAADGSELSLSVMGPYLLVGSEYYLREGAVFAPGSPEPVLILPATASSVWLPR